MRRRTPGLYWFREKLTKAWTVVKVDALQNVWFIGSEIESTMDEAANEGSFGRRIKRG